MKISIRPAPHSKSCAIDGRKSCDLYQNHQEKCAEKCTESMCCEMKHCWLVGEALEKELTDRGHSVFMADKKFRKRYPRMSVSVSVPDELLMVPMDAILIEQVLANLMENAVNHGKNATRICLSVYTKGTDAIFSVQDDGQGIAPSQIPLLFTGISHSSDNRTVDGKRNMGLGLTVCKAIVRAHGGEIIGRNLPDRGAEFAFSLPLEKSTNAMN